MFMLFYWRYTNREREFTWNTGVYATEKLRFMPGAQIERASSHERPVLVLDTQIGRANTIGRLVLVLGAYGESEFAWNTGVTLFSNRGCHIRNIRDTLKAVQPTTPRRVFATFG